MGGEEERRRGGEEERRRGGEWVDSGIGASNKREKGLFQVKRRFKEQGKLLDSKPISSHLPGFLLFPQTPQQLQQEGLKPLFYFILFYFFFLFLLLKCIRIDSWILSVSRSSPQNFKL